METRIQPRPEIVDANFDHYLIAAHNNVGSIIEASRKFIWQKIVALEQEKRHRLEYTDAYRQLYYQHGQTVTELNSMLSKNESMNAQLDEASKALSIYKSMIQDYDKRLTGDHGSSKQKFLEGRVKELEQELLNMTQKQKDSLSNAVDRINAANQKVDELNNEKNDMAERYEASLKNIESTFEIANQRIAELEKEKENMAIALALVEENANSPGSNYLLNASGRSNSAESIQSPTNEKRVRLEDNTRINLEAPPKRGRRRR